MPTAQKTLYSSSSKLSIPARVRVIEALNAALTDGMDLYTQLKVAHWNIKGPNFAALHPFFDQLATAAAGHNDALAERAIALGGLATGTARHVAEHSRLPDYPQTLTRDLEHVGELVRRIDGWIEGLRRTRATSEEVQDTDTVDLLTGMITEFEKHAWFLRATLEV